MRIIKTFRPKARLISTIGSEIIKDNYAAIIELVKNSYDADANKVEISFSARGNDFTIIIRDDGIGMSKETIFEKWLVPATDDKLMNKYSPKGRKVQGRKGIGRFSAGVLGEKLTMKSVNNGYESSIYIDWNEFSSAKFLDEVEVVIDEVKTNKPNGTEFIIHPTVNQSKEWTDDALGELIKELSKTITPIQKETPKFKIFLNIDNEVSLKFSGNIEIKPFAILDLYNYSAIGNINGQKIKFIYENKYENLKEEIEADLGDKLINICGDINFEFRAFDRDPSVIKSLTKNEMFKKMDGSKMADVEIREMLNDICGVFIFRNDFRIRPYGDVDFDWLNLDKERVQNPSVKLGANQLFGIIKIEDEEKSNLIDKSARDGLKQNESYAIFKKIILYIIREIENKRYSYRKNTGKGRNVKTSENYIILENINKLSSHKQIETSVTDILKNESLSDSAKTNLKQTFDKYEKESEKIAKNIQEQIAMYQGQATLGKIMDIIMHEVKKPLSWFNNNSEDMYIYYSEYNRTGNKAWINKILEKSETAAEQSSHIVALFKRLDPLATKTRKTCQNIKIDRIIDDVITVFRQKIEKYDIDININCNKNISFFGWKSDLMMSLTNIVENSIYWLATNKAKKLININVALKEMKLIIDISDNGPGIPIDYILSGCIFDPGFSGKYEGGSGLGLPIAGEAIARNAGLLKAIESAEGALFRIELPMMEC